MIVSRSACLLSSTAVVLHLAGPVADLGAQEAGFVPGCADAAYTGVVKGQVINDSTGLPAPRHGVFLRGSEVCIAMPDSAGQFEVRNVPSGDYELTVGDLWIRRFAPIPVTVAADTVHVEIRVQPYDIVADCSEMPECDRLLALRPPDGLLSPVDELLETGYRTAIAISIVRGGVLASWVPCVKGAESRMLEVLRREFSDAVSANECSMRPVADGVPDKRMLHLSSGRSAYVVSFKLLQASDNTASGYISLSVAPLWGSGWSCDYARGSEGWELKACQLRVQS